MARALWDDGTHPTMTIASPAAPAAVLTRWLLFWCMPTIRLAMLLQGKRNRKLAMRFPVVDAARSAQYRIRWAGTVGGYADKGASVQ